MAALCLMEIGKADHNCLALHTETPAHKIGAATYVYVIPTTDVAIKQLIMPLPTREVILTVNSRVTTP